MDFDRFFLYKRFCTTEPDRRRLSDTLRLVESFRSFVCTKTEDPRYIDGRRRYIMKRISRLESPALKSILSEAMK